MAIIDLQENEIVHEIRVNVGSHISIRYWNRETRTMSRPDLHPYTTHGFAEVKAYGDEHMFLHVGGSNDWVWSSIPF